MQPQPAHSCEDLKKLIREVPDFPKPGILFYDITTLLKDRLGFARLIDALTEHYLNKDIDLVLGCSPCRWPVYSNTRGWCRRAARKKTWKSTPPTRAARAWISSGFPRAPRYV